MYCRFADGKTPSGRSDPRQGEVLPAGQGVKLACIVKEAEITLEANGRQIYQWAGDFKRLSRRPYEPGEPLVLIAWNQGGFALDDIVLEPLGPSAGRPYLDR